MLRLPVFRELGRFWESQRLGTFRLDLHCFFGSILVSSILGGVRGAAFRSLGQVLEKSRRLVGAYSWPTRSLPAASLGFLAPRGGPRPP